MIIFVYAIEVEDYRDASLRIVEMIAAIEKRFRITRRIIFVVEFQIEKRFVHRLAQFAQFRAHNLRTDDVDFVRTCQIRIPWIGVPSLFTATYHIDIQLSDYPIDGNGR